MLVSNRVLETCVKSFSLVGKYINIYLIQKHRTKSKAKCQIEIKKSRVNKKKIKSNSFQVYLLKGLRYMKVVKLYLAILFIIITIISLQLMCNLKMIGKC